MITNSSGVVEIAAGLAFEPTLDLLMSTIIDAGLQVFGQIDHAAAARQAGLEMPPTTVLLYGNPAKGTPIMLKAPLAALDLPLRLLVREAADGQVLVAFHASAPLLEQTGLSPIDASSLNAAQELILVALQSR